MPRLSRCVVWGCELTMAVINSIIVGILLVVCIGVSVIAIHSFMNVGGYVISIPSLIVAGILGVCYWLMMMQVTDWEICKRR